MTKWRLCMCVQQQNFLIALRQLNNHTIRLTGFMGPSKIGERRKSTPIRGRILHIGKSVTSCCRNRTNKETRMLAFLEDGGMNANCQQRLLSSFTVFALLPALSTPTQPTRAMPAELLWFHSTHGDALGAGISVLLLCCWHRDFVCLGVAVCLFVRARALSWACSIPYPMAALEPPSNRAGAKATIQSEQSQSRAKPAVPLPSSQHLLLFK